jgi:AcrR family transcriptional regulator
MPRRKQLPAARDAILCAAVLEYAEHGRDGVRIENVAARAYVNKALVYRYFGDRNELFAAALTKVFTERFALLEDLPLHLPGMLKLWSDRLGSDGIFLRMLMREAIEPNCGSPGQPVNKRLRQKYYQQQIEQVKKLQNRGELPREADERYLFLMLTALVAFPYILPQIALLTTGSPSTSPAFKKRWLAHLSLIIDAVTTKNAANPTHH